MGSRTRRTSLRLVIAAIATAVAAAACTVSGDGVAPPPVKAAATSGPKPATSPGTGSNSVDLGSGAKVETDGNSGSMNGTGGSHTDHTGHDHSGSPDPTGTLAPKPTPTPTARPTPGPTLAVFSTKVLIRGQDAGKTLLLYLPPLTLPPASPYPNSRKVNATVTNNLLSDSTDVNWVVEPPGVATVSVAGLVTALKEGTAKVTANSPDSFTSDSFDLTVKAEGGVTAEVE